MTKKLDIILSRVLVDNGLIKKTAVDTILKKIAVSGEGFVSALVKRKVASEERILNILAKELRVPYVNLKKSSIEKSIIEKVPVKFAGYYKFMPIKIEGRTLTVACSEPLDVTIQDNIRTSLGYEIESVLARESDILEAFKKYYGLGAETVEKILAQASVEQAQVEESGEEKIEDIEKLAEDASVIKLVNQIILEAYKKRATDIHIEPYRGKIKLRYRIDGMLYNAPVPAQIKHFLSSLLSRIKIMANLNIVEHRLPQDGRAAVKIQDQTLDLRISFIPTPYGESVVVRLLPVKMLFSLERLGLLPADLRVFEDLVKKPHGIIFVTGPTGSGKSTTLYACLTEINTDDRKIVTIEDPIEYEVEGITQIQVTPKIGLDFGRGLRSMLRHDPDIMMVGEVRDLETAEIAIRVALTGHLVFSTLHTNDAASGVIRLINIGLEPYLVASSVESFIAQRLVRVICPECREEDKAEVPELREQIAKDLGLDSKDEIKIYKGKGCEKCNFTGFYGRTAIYEILLVDEAIKDLILKKPTSEQIKKIAVSRGMYTLRQNGWKKVISGMTTPDEVMKVTQAERYEPENFVSVTESVAKAVNEDERKTGKHGIVFRYKDKRAFSRLDTKIKIHYKVIKPKPRGFKQNDEIDYISSTRDISAGGLLFSSNSPLPLVSILELRIELLDEEKPIQCLARVVRAEEMAADNIYDIAVCFLDVSGAERNRLSKYIQERTKG